MCIFRSAERQKITVTLSSRCRASRPIVAGCALNRAATAQGIGRVLGGKPGNERCAVYHGSVREQFGGP